MTLDTFLQFCDTLPGTEQTFPFNETTLVMKAGGKMYALADITEFKSINVKCDPDEALELRERYEAVRPGYHMSKKHWNTVMLDGSIPQKEILQWIRNSYDLIIQSLPAAQRRQLDNND